MKLTPFVAAFLTATVQAGNLESAVQVSSSAEDVSENVVTATPAPKTFIPATPAPTTFAPTTVPPTPAPTHFGNPILIDTTTSTERAGITSTTTSYNGKDATQSKTAYSPEGTVGVAYITTRAEYEAEMNAANDSGNSVTVPIVIVGCLVGILGVVAAVVIGKKRKAVVVEEGNDETSYSNSVHTPAAAKTKYFRVIPTPETAEHKADCFDAINGHAV